MGKLKINGDLLLTGSISFQTSNCTTPAFSVNVDSSGYGQNLLIGAGGNTVIGGGESASAFFFASGIKDEENLYLTADDSIYIYTNCGSIENRKLVMSATKNGISVTGLLTATKSDSDTPFVVNTTLSGADGAYIAFQINGTTLGYLAVDANNRPIFYKSGAKYLLHSENYTDYTVTKTGSGASGTWGINVNGYSAKLAYAGDSLKTADLLNGFNEARRLSVGIWENDLVPGCGNGIIINGGWTSTTYGFQLAIDDDPTYFMALRQKGTGGWNEWKRIPMGDGTGASGTWGISITGSASSASKSLYTTYDDTNIAYAGWSNELNFGGSNASSTIYFGYRALDSKPIPTNFVFGGSSGTATITAANFTGTWQGNSPSAFAPASHSHSYVPLSGGTMTGKLQVNSLIFGFNYTNTNNAAAFMFDKPGTHYTGIGANGSTSTIKFGPCNADGTWVSNFDQHWVFQGTIRPGCIILTNDQWTGYGSAHPDDAGLDRVEGRLYFQV